MSKETIRLIAKYFTQKNIHVIVKEMQGPYTTKELIKRYFESCKSSNVECGQNDVVGK